MTDDSELGNNASRPGARPVFYLLIVLIVAAVIWFGGRMGWLGGDTGGAGSGTTGEIEQTDEPVEAPPLTPQQERDAAQAPAEDAASGDVADPSE